MMSTHLQRHPHARGKTVAWIALRDKVLAELREKPVRRPETILSVAVKHQWLAAEQGFGMEQV